MRRFAPEEGHTPASARDRAPKPASMRRCTAAQPRHLQENVQRDAEPERVVDKAAEQPQQQVQFGGRPADVPIVRQDGLVGPRGVAEDREGLVAVGAEGDHAHRAILLQERAQRPVRHGVAPVVPVGVHLLVRQLQVRLVHQVLSAGDVRGSPSPGCIRREGTSEAAPAAVRQAVEGGCQSGWGRLLSVTNTTEAGTWRQGVAGHRPGALEGVEGPMHPCPPPPSLYHTVQATAYRYPGGEGGGGGRDGSLAPHAPTSENSLNEILQRGRKLEVHFRY